MPWLWGRGLFLFRPVLRAAGLHYSVCLWLQVKEMLSRNRAALDALTAALLDKEQLQGPAVYEVLDRHLTEADRQQRQQAAKDLVFM